jgi:chemotaxis protein CheD
MFKFANATDIMRVGERNAEAVKTILKDLNIKLIANDTGGNYGRTVELKLETGVYRIKTIDKGEKEL